MLTQKGYRFRIYPNKKQEELISSFFGCCRYVYNICLTYRKDLYVSEKRNVSRYECMRKITLMRSDPETPWLKDCDSMALQESVKDLDRAYESFFGKRSGYPKYHKKHSSVQSYRTEIRTTPSVSKGTVSASRSLVLSGSKSRERSVERY